MFRALVRLRNEDKFPFTALRLPHLKSLEVKAYEYHYIRFLEEETTASDSLQKRNPNITSLLLHLRNAAAFFTRSGSVYLFDRFPSLINLDLNCFGCPELINAFTLLPRTLKSVKIVAHERPYSTGETHVPLPMTAIAKLPRSLASIEISWNHIAAPENPSEYKALLPPQLTALKLSPVDGEGIFAHLPAGLETLSLKFKKPAAFEAKTSLLPATLTSLEIDVPLSFDAALPARLTKFEVPSASCREVLTLGNGVGSSWKGLPLPVALEVSPPSFEDLSADVLARFKRFNNITVATQGEINEICTSQEKGFPKQLTLGTKDLRFAKALPCGVNKVVLHDWMHGDDIKMLPATLTELNRTTPEIMQASDLTLDVSAKPASWTFEQVAQFPKYLRKLHLPFAVVDEGKKLAPISGLFLERFELIDVPSNEYETAPEWLAACLPFHLKELQIQTRMGPPAGDAKQFSVGKSLAACNLRAVVPHLKHLMLWAFPFVDDNSMASVFVSLPRALDYFFISCPNNAIELGAVAHLPRTLEHFDLNFHGCINDASEDDDLKDLLTAQHFERLPERLGYLRVILPKQHRINRDMLQFLPKSVCLVAMYAPKNDIADWKADLQQLLSSNAKALQ